MGWDPQEFCSKRSELAHEFLNAAPFTELSYFIWRRIAGEDGDDCANSHFAFTTPSERFLPQVEFRLAASACPSPRRRGFLHSALLTPLPQPDAGARQGDVDPLNEKAGRAMPARRAQIASKHNFAAHLPLRRTPHRRFGPPSGDDVLGAWTMVLNAPASSPRNSMDCSSGRSLAFVTTT